MSDDLLKYDDETKTGLTQRGRCRAGGDGGSGGGGGGGGEGSLLSQSRRPCMIRRGDWIGPFHISRRSHCSIGRTLSISLRPEHPNPHNPCFV